jgi:hypothetical protein
MREKPIFFSWEKIVKHCNSNIFKILKCFKTEEYKKFPGTSFLLEYTELFKLPSTYDAELIEYIALASRRNYFDAEYLHNARLSIYYIYDIDLNKLKSNRLLKIVGKELLFKYEEYYGNQIWRSSRQG